MPLIKGTASVSDSRALLKALRSTKFPPSFSTAVDLSKVNKPVLAQWIENRITAILGFEDDIVQSTAVNMFVPSSSSSATEESTVVEVDPKKAQLDMAGFLGDDEAAKFSKELWEMMVDAQTSPMGIPTKLLEEKKKELAMIQQQAQEQSLKNAAPRARLPPPPPHHPQQQQQPRHQHPQQRPQAPNHHYRQDGGRGDFRDRERPHERPSRPVSPPQSLHDNRDSRRGEHYRDHGPPRRYEPYPDTHRYGPPCDDRHDSRDYRREPIREDAFGRERRNVRRPSHDRRHSSRSRSVSSDDRGRSRHSRRYHSPSESSSSHSRDRTRRH